MIVKNYNNVGNYQPNLTKTIPQIHRTKRLLGGPGENICISPGRTIGEVRGIGRILARKVLAGRVPKDPIIPEPRTAVDGIGPSVVICVRWQNKMEQQPTCQNSQPAPS